MILLLLLLTLCAGAVIPLQTSINARLHHFTHSSFYTSAISFLVGSLTLAIVILCFQPHYFTPHTLSTFQLDYRWVIGGLMGVIFLTGNLLLLPRIGASLTVVTTLSGQLIMSLLIDTFGWFHLPMRPLTIVKILGLILLFTGIILMNLTSKQATNQIHNRIWLIVGVLFGAAPPIQTAINSSLGQLTHSSLFAAFVSFTVGTATLFLLTIIFHRRFKIYKRDTTSRPLRWWYFTGGMLGAIFVTTNIIVAPILGITVSLIIVMLGQIIMGLCIDHFGWLNAPTQAIHLKRILGLLCVIVAIFIIQLN